MINAQTPNSTFIYLLFSNILEQNTVIEGRFYRVNSMSDLQASNFNQLTYDAVGGLKNPDIKYPCAVILPMGGKSPYPQPITGWQNVNIQIAFLQANQKDNPEDFNGDTNTTTTVPMDDQDAMSAVATDFYAALNSMVRYATVNNGTDKLCNWIFNKDKTAVNVDPKALQGNDVHNGVMLNFSIEINDGIIGNFITTFTQQGMDAIEVPTGFIPQT